MATESEDNMTYQQWLVWNKHLFTPYEEQFDE